MKTLKKFVFLAAIAVLMSSCAAMTAGPVMGLLYTDAKSPVAVTSNANSSKVGTAEATSILGLVGTGDASIEKAAKSAGITKIHHVDQHGTSILGIYAKYTIYVYGE